MGYRDIKFDENSVFLVGGGAGFIGSNICEALIDMGYRVRCLDDLSTGKYENIEALIPNERFTFIKGDIRELEWPSRPSFFGNSVESPYTEELDA